ncbi:MAG: hypothetical protein JSV27_02625 [Candidatus Bathyarchaeota archaeon]|nr:MAG: hypothetical protein JSV27_02625 [Candidatus Bathyarchaeota archaeon]
MIRKLWDRIVEKIRAYDDESGRRRPHLWYLAGAGDISGGFYGEVSETEWIDDALEADYRRNPKWQKPTILDYYPKRDLYDKPAWEEGKLGRISPVWWAAVAFFALFVVGGLIWGFMNRAGA